MKNGPMRFGHVAAARRTVQLAPRATVGMAIRAQVPKTDPAPIRTADMGTEVH